MIKRTKKCEICQRSSGCTFYQCFFKPTAEAVEQYKRYITLSNLSLLDPSVKDLSDEDKFLIMLYRKHSMDCGLQTKDLIRQFGGSSYHWRKVAKRILIKETASLVGLENGGYYGSGWCLIESIKRHIKE